MNGSSDDRSRASLRWGVYAILIAVSAGMMVGRILSVDSVDKRGAHKSRFNRRLNERREEFIAKGLEGEKLEEALEAEKARLDSKLRRYRRPFLSANDRSRWCAIRVLVEDDLRVEGHPYAIDKLIGVDGWDTIDMVKHDGRGHMVGDGEGHFYSSKPPLLPTLLAGEYWIIHRLTGATLGTHPYAIGRFMLILNNVVGWVIAMVLLACLAERLGTTDWGRIFMVAAAALATFLTTFAVALNNHLVAAVCVTICLYAFVKIWLDGRREYRWFVLAGLFGALTAANELPALSFLGLLGLALLIKAPRQTLLAFAPMVVLVAAGFFGTNWIAHHNLRPPYMHRVEGDNWYDYSFERGGRTVESHWRNPGGLDAGEPQTGVYAFHCLLGHHGIFSLTPIWLLTIGGVAIWLRRRDDPRLREMTLGIAIVSVVCLLFFTVIEHDGRNYGGSTSGFRWVFWLAPLWLVGMLPVLDVMSRRRWTIVLAVILLALSALSASYPTWNPWAHPWLYETMRHYGWLGVH